jgi:diguanylate cyclase (GGDEF)-like protein/PAS domain S-box-containing protein
MESLRKKRMGDSIFGRKVTEARVQLDAIKLKNSKLSGENSSLLSNDLERFSQLLDELEVDGISAACEISEREKKQESLSQLAVIVETSDDAIFSETLDGVILSWNAGAEKLFGYTSEEVIGKTISMLIPVERSKDFSQIVQKIRNGERICHYETVRQAKDGRVFDVALTVSPIRDDTGKITYSSVVARDITENKQVEELLREEKELAQKYLDVVGVMIIGFNLNTDVVMINQKGCAILGCSDEKEVIGKNWMEHFVPRAFRRDVQNAFKQMIAGNLQLLEFYENPILTLKGEERLISWHNTVLRDGQGRIQVILSSGEDITEKRVAADELYRSRQMLQLVLDAIPQRVFWKDLHSVYLGANRAMALDARLPSPEAIIGKRDENLWWRAEAERFQAEDEAVMRSNLPKLNYQIQQEYVDGRKVWLRKNKIPLHGRDGKVIGLLGTEEDITDQKTAEEELRFAREKLILWVSDLENRNRDADLLRQMGDMLQVCNSFDEAYSVIQQYTPLLFPDTSGGLFIMNDAHNAMEVKAEWGKDLNSERVFPPEDCWAMRRGQIHIAIQSEFGLRCRHVGKDFHGNYLGIPMMASGEALGVLHIHEDEGNPGVEMTQELARTVAEHLALSLSNLRLRETLRAQSIRDVLTGLYNRRYMEESLERELHRAIRKQIQVGIVMLDIDHFKHFNDAYGHDAGDAVLREIGNLLLGQIRGEDIACRFGGEEFILILPDASMDAILDRSNQIKESIRSLAIEHRHKSLGRVTISIGIAIFPDHGSSAKAVLRKADEALYTAKLLGRDCVAVSGLTYD